MSNNNILDVENIFSGDLIADFGNNLPEPLNSKNAIFTLYARNGLYHIAKQIINEKPEKGQALVPSYSCGDEIETIFQAGFTSTPYRIDANLQADLNDIKSKIGKKTGFVLLTHYLGFPQKEISSIKKICENNGIFLIEDCAHVFGGTFESKPLGIFGDASIFSLRKFLNIPHGGALVINNRNLNQTYFNQPQNEAVLIDLFIFLGQRNGLFKKGTPINKIYEQIGLDNKNQHGPRLENFGGYNLALSNLAKFLIKKNDIPGTINSRIINFNAYLNIFLTHTETRVKPLVLSLPNGVVPLMFPIIVEDAETFCAKLRDKSINFCQPFWSYLHKYVDWIQYPEAKMLKKRVVALPVDTEIDKEMIIKIIQN